MMVLTQEDAYAFRRLLCKMELPENLALSPLVGALVKQLDWTNDRNHQFLERIVCANTDIRQQVMQINPVDPYPPQSGDDHAYVEQYLKLVLTTPHAPPPDPARTNGSTALLQSLYQLNFRYGPQMAEEAFNQRSPMQSFDQSLNQEPIGYLDEEKVIQEKELTAVVGQPGSGKSFWTLRKLADLAENMPVLYVAAEGFNAERLYALRRARETEGIAHTKQFSDNFQIYNMPLDLTRDENIDLFLHHLGDFRPKVIAIDTFAACTPGIDENNSKDVQPVLNRVRRLINHLGCAVLLIHHTTKDGKTFRGSSALRGNVANMYYLIQDNGRITLRSDKQRDAEASPDRHYRLVKFDTRLHPQSGEQLHSVVMMPAEKVIVSETPKKLCDKKMEILRQLNGETKGVRTGQLYADVHMSRTTLWRYLRDLILSGYVRTAGKGEPMCITQQGIEIYAKNGGGVR